MGIIDTNLLKLKEWGLFIGIAIGVARFDHDMSHVNHVNHNRHIKDCVVMMTIMMVI